MAVFEIPLTPEAQTFVIDLGGVTYGLRFVWNAQSACWILDISDTLGNPIAQGIPVITGADLVKQFAYLGFRGKIIVQTDHDSFTVPSLTTLGVTGRVYLATP